MVLFITEQGARLIKRGHVLMVYKEGEKRYMFPLEAISQLVIMGRVEISTALLGLLMRQGVDTVLLTVDGRYKGRISGETSKNIFAREKQFRRRDQPDFCLAVSRALITAKAINTRNWLRRSFPELHRDVRSRFDKALASIARAESINQLRGLEGSLAAYSFSLFPRLLRGEFTFRSRQKRPPKDPVNALLSLGYTFLFNTIYGLVEAAGLDPYAGFFHQGSYGHPALVSDLQEPYRAQMVDRLVISMLNKKSFAKEDFSQTEDGLRLSQEALQRFVTQFQKRLFRKFPRGEQKVSLWHILQQDVWKLLKFIQGDADEFRPHTFQ